jgi:hypothetical protein
VRGSINKGRSTVGRTYAPFAQGETMTTKKRRDALYLSSIYLVAPGSMCTIEQPIPPEISPFSPVRFVVSDASLSFTLMELKFNNVKQMLNGVGMELPCAVFSRDAIGNRMRFNTVSEGEIVRLVVCNRGESDAPFNAFFSENFNGEEFPKTPFVYTM